MKLFILCYLFAISAFAEVGNFSLDNSKTLYIVDGDSISLQMRIQGIDTPEITQTCEPTSNQVIDCGHLAKRHLKNLLKNLPGKLRIEPKGFDHYHRVLVKVYKGDVNIGNRMVEEGMAFSYKNTYRQAEDEARKHKRGFWGFHKPPIKPYQWRRLNPR